MADTFEDELEDDANDPNLRTRATDFVRKALVAGAGALFLGEEGIRSVVGELKLPKEIIGSVLSQADHTKQEIVRTLGAELRRFLESAALHEQLGKLLEDATIEVKAEIRLKPKGPELVEKPQVVVKRTPPPKKK